MHHSSCEIEDFVETPRSQAVCDAPTARITAVGDVSYYKEYFVKAQKWHSNDNGWFLLV